jgi:hypothetical protein
MKNNTDIVIWLGNITNTSAYYINKSASDKVYRVLAQGRWFSPGTPASSSTTKTGRHDIAEILLKVALKHQKLKNKYILICIWDNLYYNL